MLLDLWLDVFQSFYNFYLQFYICPYYYISLSIILYQIPFLYSPNVQFYISTDFLHLITNLNLALSCTQQIRLSKYYIKPFYFCGIPDLTFFMTNPLAYCWTDEPFVINLACYFLLETKSNIWLGENRCLYTIILLVSNFINLC